MRVWNLHREASRGVGLILCLGLLLSGGRAVAGTTGKLAGQVLDQDKQPVAAATIVLLGTRFGAYSDADGNYTILQVPPGSYEVSCKRLGFAPVTTTEVVISADQTTRLPIEMGESTIQTEEVVVVAERPPVDLNLTSSKSTVTSESIEELPVQDLEDVVNLQAGVVEGHFRGGRTGEVQYQVDGVSVNNAFNNQSSVKLDRSLLQEVQVISGTFDAEYGQAMSGVVNAVLKQGTEDFQWSGEAYSGSFVFRDGDRRLTANRISPEAIQNYQLTVRGPLPIPNTVFLLSGRRYLFDDYVYGERRFQVTDSSDFENKVFVPTGDGTIEPLGYSREWSGVAKITNNSLQNSKLNYQVLINQIEGRRNDFAFRFNPDGLSHQKTFSIAHGLDWTQTLGPSTFLDFSVRQNYLKFTDHVYESASDSAYDFAGPLRGDRSYAIGAFVQGVDFTRFEQQTNSVVLKTAVTSQLSQTQQLKVGMEFERPNVKFGTPGYLTYTTIGGEQALVRHFDEPPDFPGVRSYTPLSGATFVQDNIERSDLTIRAGMRLDYFDARSTVPSDLANPANSIVGAPQSVPRATSKKVYLSPRLGVAYPIEDRAAIHFAYGHFRQFPAIGQMFSNADYDVLRNLQAGGVSFGVLGNPDVRPEMTVQYEVGYKQAFTADLGADVTIFYKDVRDLLGVEFVQTYNGAEYARLTNIDFGNILGFTVSLDHRALGPASISLDYTWQQALGNASDPRETATRAEAGQDPRPRLTPFNWDQRHTFNLTAAISKPDDYSVSAILRVASGQPYTPVIESGFGNGLEENSGRKPIGAILDLRAEKTVGLMGQSVSLFTRVFNVLDSRFFNGGVFSSTGSPYYSRFPEADAEALQNPTRYYPPRRIEIGIHFGS